MKYTFKILGALPGQDLIEIEVKPTNTILDIKYKLIKKAKLKVDPHNLKFVLQNQGK